MKDANYKVIIELDRVPRSGIQDILLWCLDAFGPIGPQWDWDITHADRKTYYSFYFDRKDDSVQFTLAWH